MKILSVWVRDDEDERWVFYSGEDADENPECHDIDVRDAERAWKHVGALTLEVDDDAVANALALKVRVVE